MPKPLTVWITTNWKILKDMGMPHHLTCLLRNLYAGQETQQLELDMEQQIGSKSGNEYVKAVYCHPAYLTYMQSSVQFSHSVVSNSLRPQEPQHARPPCPSPTPRVYSDSRSLIRSNHLILCRLFLPTFDLSQNQTWVQSLDQADPLEKGRASILA